MSRHDLVSAQNSNVCTTRHAAVACSYVSNNLWCHFQQCPWDYYTGVVIVMNSN